MKTLDYMKFMFYVERVKVTSLWRGLDERRSSYIAINTRNINEIMWAALRIGRLKFLQLMRPYVVRIE